MWTWVLLLLNPRITIDCLTLEPKMLTEYTMKKGTIFTATILKTNYNCNHFKNFLKE